jgi:hypothetical protein
MRQTICYPIPLADGFLTQLVLPRNLTRAEVCKLRRVLWALQMPQVHEDELPPMSDEAYAAWFDVSYVPDGVGCRMRPAVGPNV